MTMKLKNQEITTGGSFIIKDTPAAQVFTPEDFNEEQQMMKAAVQEFVDREIWPNKPRFEQKDYTLVRELMTKAGALGFLGISVPEAYGGLGMDFVYSMMVCDYISGATGSFSTAYGAHTGIGILPITLYGTEEQKLAYVPKLASGEWIGSYCLTEPGAGSDANSGKSKAVLSEDGTYYSITGQKMWISNAGFANLFIVFARIEDDKNITGFIVPNNPDNGITLGEEENKLGIHASSTRQVFFNQTKVPVENILGERNGGFKIAVNALNVGRIKLGVACLDGQRRAISEAIGYANSRIQFKTPISQFGAIKEKLARMASSCYVGEAACYRAAADIKNRVAQLTEEEGFSHQKSELKGVEDFAIECSIIKVAASEDIQNCTDEAIQIFGGMGFSADTPIESAWRDARIGRIYEGTNEINRMLSVGMLLKKALKGQLDLMTAVMQATAAIENTTDETANGNVGPLASEQALLKKLKNVFLMLIGQVFQKFGNDLESQQQILLYLSNILIEIYFAESGILRTIKNCNRFGNDNQKAQLAMTQLYLFEASEIILKNAKETIISISDAAQQKQLLETVTRACSPSEWPNVVALKTSIADQLIAENKYCF